ncbi:MAG: class I SAM-dependent methyltransferase [Gammaproteobacteria bacterium]|nr:class I SAM-dependent methyltransferase [Gammaproteobacteria bacterium]
MTTWDDRYAASSNLFGDDPSPLLLEFRARFLPGMTALAIGDGEGRNGVWLARQGLDVLSIDLSDVALARSRQRAHVAGVPLRTLRADILAWDWPEAAFDFITLIFVHLPPEQKRQLHRAIRRALKPGGVILLEAFHRAQIECGSGGPSDPDLLYTLAEVEQDFSGFEALKCAQVETDVVLDGEPQGKGCAVHFVAQRPHDVRRASDPSPPSTPGSELIL